MEEGELNQDNTEECKFMHANDLGNCSSTFAHNANNLVAYRNFNDVNKSIFNEASMLDNDIGYVKGKSLKNR